MKKIGDPLRNDFGSPGTISQKTGLKYKKKRVDMPETGTSFYIRDPSYEVLACSTFDNQLSHMQCDNIFFIKI